MIKSMTAFARVQHSEKFGTLTWEMRSVNHRYLEVTCRMPEDLRGLEGRVREKINKRLKRGKVECNLRFKPELASDTGIVINEAFGLRTRAKPEEEEAVREVSGAGH